MEKKDGEFLMSYQNVSGEAKIQGESDGGESPPEEASWEEKSCLCKL